MQTPNIIYDMKTNKSEYQIHMESLRHLLINMQEVGVDDRYGDNVSNTLPNLIKWLTDKIELAKREQYFKCNIIDNNQSLNDVELKVLKLINDITSCICYPNDALFPNVKTVTEELKNIFTNNKTFNSNNIDNNSDAENNNVI